MIFKKNNKRNNGGKNTSDGVALISNAPREDECYVVPAKSLMLAIDSKDENYNIGIIGSFGSGKSSLLKTYKALNKKKRRTKRRKIVSVSLASFFNANNDNKSKTEESEEYLESIIIQQILYSVSRWKLPASRINRIGFRVRTIFLFLFAILCALSFIVSSNVAFFGLGEIEDIQQYLFYSGISLSILTLVMLFECYPITSIVAKIKNVEIKSEPNIKSTLFDEYLDELLYFFHKTRTSVVIFEDIDRCYTDDIFNRLRTLNITLNNNKWFSKKKKKIHFVYAVKEDLFISSETKSKFFDVLISLPALLSQDNVLNHIKLVLKGHNITTLDDVFLSHIATYIISYRQINNITNDYILMSKTKYRKTGIDSYTAKRLFAVLAYKSIFPYDYLEFLKNDGYLYHYIKKNDVDLTTLDKKYKNVYNESTPKDEIKSFYKLLSNYFDTASLSLISNFVEGDYENDEQKLFYDRLKANPDFYDVDAVYSNPFCILNHPYALQYSDSNSFLNISIIETAFKKKNMYASFLKNFSKSFSKNTQNKKTFIDKVSLLIKENSRFVFAFFESIAPVYTSLTSELKINGFFKNTPILKRYLKQVIKTKDIASFQNVPSLFSDLLENDSNADVILCELNAGLREQLLTIDFKLKSLDIVSYFKNSTRNYKKSLYELICNNKFNLNLENFKRIGVVVADYYNFEAPAPSAIAYGASLDKRINAITNELNTFIDNGSYPQKEFGDYKNCSNDVIIASLKLFTNLELKEQIMNTCNPIVIDKADILDVKLVGKMLLMQKIKAPISTWKKFLDLSPNTKEQLCKSILESYDSVLVNEEKKNKDYYDLLYSILNDEKCNYALAGNILELTCDIHSLSIADISNKDAIKCAIDYEYVLFNEEDLTIVPIEYLPLFFLKYEATINSIPDPINIDNERIKYLLKNVGREKQPLVIRKTVSTINETNVFIQDYTNVICEDINSFTVQFIRSFLTSPLLLNDNKVAVLLASYSQIDDLKAVLESLKNQRTAFKQSDAFLTFKDYLYNHKVFCHTFQYSKKKDCYYLRRL